MFDDVFGGSRSSLDAVIDKSRHVRECESCRSELVKTFKPLGRVVLREMERDLRRSLSSSERKLVASSLLIFASICDAVELREIEFLAAEQSLAGLMREVGEA